MDWLWLVFLFCYNLLIISISILIIFEKRSPVQTLSWLLALVFLPGFGLVLFIIFGRNHRRKKKIKQKYIVTAGKQYPGHDFSFQKLISRKKDLKFITHLLKRSSQSIVRSNNYVKVLYNGRDKFNSLLQNIQKAKKFIFLEYYIIEKEFIQGQLLNSLLEKARLGLDVRILLDNIGSWNFSNKVIEELRAEKVEVEMFMPVFSLLFADRINNRNHRKIAIIDGKVAYMGGMNLSNSYLSTESNEFEWKDVHLEIQGDCIADLIRIFISDWNFASLNKMNLSKYKPVVSNKNKLEKCSLQIIASGPDSQWASIRFAFSSAINIARKYIYITTPYFLPDESIVSSLCIAALGGVDVKIMLPAKSDSWFVGLGSLSYVEELQNAGIEVYFYEKAFNHSKYMVVDDYFVNIGSANMDNRSFEHNFEINAMIYDKKIACELKKSFELDLFDSRKAYFKKGGIFEKFVISLARLFSPVF